jgi:hypothetical protein
LISFWELLIKNKHYEEEHGNNRQSDQDSGCRGSSGTIFYTRYLRNAGNNIIAFCRSFYSNKLPEFLSALSSIWFKYEEERIERGADFSYAPYLCPLPPLRLRVAAAAEQGKGVLYASDNQKVPFRGFRGSFKTDL